MQQSHTPTHPDAKRPAPTPWRLLAGLGSSCAAGIGIGKLVRGPLKGQVHDLDDALLKATRKSESPILDRVMPVMSALGEPWALYSLSGASALIWLAKGRGRDSATLGLAILGSAIIDKVAKSATQRPRPYLKLPLPSSRASGSSFPSNHSMMSLATYGAIAALAGRKRRNVHPPDSSMPQLSVVSDQLSADDQPKDPELRSKNPRGKDQTGGQKHSTAGRSGTPDRNRAKRARKRMMGLGLGLALGALVGWSRVYKGVHNPSDVMGGWILGGYWLFVCYSWGKTS